MSGYRHLKYLLDKYRGKYVIKFGDRPWDAPDNEVYMNFDNTDYLTGWCPNDMPEWRAELRKESDRAVSALGWGWKSRDDDSPAAKRYYEFIDDARKRFRDPNEYFAHESESPDCPLWL